VCVCVCARALACIVCDRMFIMLYVFILYLCMYVCLSFKYYGSSNLLKCADLSQAPSL